MLIYSYSVLEAIDYTQNCGKVGPDCMSYHDGCNDCHCDPDIGNQACTKKVCFVDNAKMVHIG